MSESPQPVIPSLAPRARVASHLRHLLTLGATSMTLACWPLACDPPAPPAACREKGSVLSSIEALVAPAGTQDVEVSIQTRSNVHGAYAVRLTRIAITGGTATALTPTSPAINADRVTPASPGGVIQLSYSATCDGSAAKGIRVTLTPRAGDAGAADAGTPTSYEVSLTEV